MTLPTPPSGHRERRDFYHFPALGDATKIRGLVSTTYLRRGEVMVVGWSEFWEEMVLQNFVDVVSHIEEPSANEYFPTVAEVWNLIEQGATTLPGEKIIGMRADDSKVYLRVGVSAQSSREYVVEWPEMYTMINNVVRLRDETGELSNNAIAALRAGTDELKNLLVDYNGIASAAAGIALDAAEEAQKHVGESGASAYEIAVAEGFEGSESEWLESLRGEPGEPGEPGADGEPGPKGEDGTSVTIRGAVDTAADLPTGLGEAEAGDGWVSQNDGHLHVWGGESWADVGPVRGPQGVPGEDGADGEPGPRGASAYEVAVAEGFVGSESEWLEALRGEDGASAYAVALANGFDGSQSEWLESLRGAPGADGKDGTDGADGADGAPGTTNFEDLEGLPSTFPPDTHEHEVREVKGLSGQLSAITSAMGGLSFRVVSSLPANPDPSTIYFVEE